MDYEKGAEMTQTELKPCKCKSYNGDHPPYESEILTLPSWISDMLGGKKKIAVDPCISEQIKKLWDNGIVTYSSCCGHNGRFQRHVIVDTFENEKSAQILLGPTFLVWSMERPQSASDLMNMLAEQEKDDLTKRVDMLPVLVEALQFLKVENLNYRRLARYKGYHHICTKSAWNELQKAEENAEKAIAAAKALEVGE